MGDLSAHFSTSEFRCHHCGAAKVSPELIQRLERLRAILGRPLPILSGYRCAYHNSRVGGAPRSLHLVGMAADLTVGLARVDEALAAGFNGVGYRRGWAVHVDVRRTPQVTFPD